MISPKMGKRILKVTATAPLFLQSKLLCFSVLYLFTAIFLALYTTIYPYQCLFRSSPYDPILSSNLYFYPDSYGAHKYALSTSRSKCTTPVFFNGYWEALREVQDLCGEVGSVEGLRYLEGRGESFGGNFSAENRFSYFNRIGNESREVPCGFLTTFPIADSDRRAMEKCEGLVVVSAVMNDHDKIRQPRGLGSKTPTLACFFMFVDDATLQSLTTHKTLVTGRPGDLRLGFWRLVNVNFNVYPTPSMNGVIPKYLVHRLFPNSKFSVWLDAKLQLMVDPFLLVQALLVREGWDVAVSKHPVFVDAMEEAMATARWRKWGDFEGLKRQMETYCDNGMLPWSLEKKKPYTTDVPDSAMILRRHTLATNLFSCLMFNELEAFNPRDQLAFGYVRDQMSPKVKMNMFEAEVFEQVVVEYRHNLKKNAVGPTRTQVAAYDWNHSDSSCHSYLHKLWGDAADSHNN